jgi:uncharacterized membrane protein YeaQ/YmgE (transglycosylase-associated protein family)
MTSLCKCIFSSLGILSLLAFAALVIACFVSTIISFASVWEDGNTGWTGIQTNCSKTLRDTMLVVIIMQSVCGSIGGKLFKKDEYGAAGVIYVITFGVLGSILASYYSEVVEGGGICNIYMDSKTSFNSPGNVYMYQIATSWIFVIAGILAGIVACFK